MQRTVEPELCPSMKLTFWGTRGSLPSPGRETVRYGGNTPCVEVRLAHNNLVIFDAGTGLRDLGDAIIAAGGSLKAFLAISHPHWDHIQGFPFKPLCSRKQITIIGAQTRNITLRQMIASQMDRSTFRSSSMSSRRRSASCRCAKNRPGFEGRSAPCSSTILHSL
jgi:phosphoribosyl 1,2-cyclic phosphodiesterase